MTQHWHLQYRSFQPVMVYASQFYLEWEKGVIVGDPVCQYGKWGLNVKLLHVMDLKTHDNAIVRIEDRSNIRSV